MRNKFVRVDHNPLVAIVVIDFRPDARKTSTVEIAPVETVISRTETSGFIK